MKVIPTAAVLGAEIAEVDLSRRLDGATFAAIERAYDEYGVIFFRGQSITPAQQVTFTRRFGEIEFNIFGERWSVPGHRETTTRDHLVRHRGPRPARAHAGRHRVRQCRRGLGRLAGCDEAKPGGTASRVRFPRTQAGPDPDAGGNRP